MELQPVIILIILSMVAGFVIVIFYRNPAKHGAIVEQPKEKTPTEKITEMPKSPEPIKELDPKTAYDTNHKPVYTDCDKRRGSFCSFLGYKIRHKDGFLPLPSGKGTYDFQHYDCKVDEEKCEEVWRVRYSDSLGRSGIFRVHHEENTRIYYILIDGERVLIYR